MYEYKVEAYKVKDAEAAMNKPADVSLNEAMGFDIVVTYECNK